MTKYIVSTKQDGEYDHKYVKLAHEAGAVVEFKDSDQSWVEEDPNWVMGTMYRAIITPDMAPWIQQLVNSENNEPVSKRHKWTDVIIAWANGEDVEVQGSDGAWVKIGEYPVWYEDKVYRVKPKTIKIGKIEVPEPLREAPNFGERYCFIDFSEEGLVSWGYWRGSKYDFILLNRGMCHYACAYAIAHAQALIVVSGGQV